MVFYFFEPRGDGKKYKKMIFYKKYLFIDQKDKERARLSRDGEGSAPHPPNPSRDGEERAWGRGGGAGRRERGGCALFAITAGGGLGGAPFAVTAEPRPLSLFIFVVDE